MSTLRHSLTLVLFFLFWFPLTGRAGIDVDLSYQLYLLEQGETPPPLIKYAKFRVAVFTYDDPDGPVPKASMLGDALARLVAHEILMNSRVSSLGVLNFTGGVGPKVNDRLSYYDKVERITGAQGVSLAVWGTVRRVRGELWIDSYVQIPQHALKTSFTWRLVLPGPRESPYLRARLRPDRIPVQRLRLPAHAEADLIDAAEHLLRLLRARDRNAKVVGLRPLEQVFIVRDRRGDWVYLELPAKGLKGWVPLRGHCMGGCKPFLEVASFGSGLLRYIRAREKPPWGTASLTTEALAVSEQIEALDALQQGRVERARELARRWVGSERLTGLDPETGIDRGTGLPPGGAAFTNIGAMAEVAEALRKTLGSEQASTIAFRLAEASQYDPRNEDVLQNLAVIFRLAGDIGRAKLAQSIIEQSSP